MGKRKKNNGIRKCQDWQAHKEPQPSQMQNLSLLMAKAFISFWSVCFAYARKFQRQGLSFRG